jgi:hypothetical protein
VPSSQLGPVRSDRHLASLWHFVHLSDLGRINPDFKASRLVSYRQTRPGIKANLIARGRTRGPTAPNTRADWYASQLAATTMQESILVMAFEATLPQPPARGPPTSGGKEPQPAADTPPPVDPRSDPRYDSEPDQDDADSSADDDLSDDDKPDDRDKGSAVAARGTASPLCREPSHWYTGLPALPAKRAASALEEDQHLSRLINCATVDEIDQATNTALLQLTTGSPTLSGGEPGSADDATPQLTGGSPTLSGGEPGSADDAAPQLTGGSPTLSGGEPGSAVDAAPQLPGRTARAHGTMPSTTGGDPAETPESQAGMLEVYARSQSKRPRASTRRRSPARKRGTQ